ncbi:MAG: FAD-dependent oxidoreductase, partial [Actinomycetota bacterium]
MAVRFLIIGGGPAGNTAATYAARLGAEVVMVERDVVGGAAHLLDCIPSKTMIATGGAMSFGRKMQGMGLEKVRPSVDVEALTDRISDIKDHLSENTSTLLQSQGVRIVSGTARFTSSTTARITLADGSTEDCSFDAALVATGSRPRVPDWVTPDGDRILTTRDCYPPRVFPSSVCVIGSGVTGVEFVHMFES